MPRFIAFVNMEEAKELGVDLSLTYGPCQLYATGIKDYSMFSRSAPRDPEQDQKFRELEADTKYRKIVVAGN